MDFIYFESDGLFPMEKEKERLVLLVPYTLQVYVTKRWCYRKYFNISIFQKWNKRHCSTDGTKILNEWIYPKLALKEYQVLCICSWASNMVLHLTGMWKKYPDSEKGKQKGMHIALLLCLLVCSSEQTQPLKNEIISPSMFSIFSAEGKVVDSFVLWAQA